MKLLSFITRTLLGLIFLASGVSGVIPGHAPSFTTTLARQYMMVMQATPYGHILFAGQILCGLLLITDVFAPLALVVLGAYLFNIVMFHLFFEPGHLAIAFVLVVLWVLTASRYRAAFHPLLKYRVAAQGQVQ